MSKSKEMLADWFEAALRTIDRQYRILLDGIEMWERGVPWPEVLSAVRADLERTG